MDYVLMGGRLRRKEKYGVFDIHSSPFKSEKEGEEKKKRWALSQKAERG